MANAHKDLRKFSKIIPPYPILCNTCKPHIIIRPRNCSKIRKGLDKDKVIYEHGYNEDNRGRSKTNVASEIKVDRIRRSVTQLQERYLLLSSSDEDNPEYQVKIKERRRRKNKKILNDPKVVRSASFDKIVGNKIFLETLRKFFICWRSKTAYKALVEIEGGVLKKEQYSQKRKKVLRMSCMENYDYRLEHKELMLQAMGTTRAVMNVMQKTRHRKRNVQKVAPALEEETRKQQTCFEEILEGKGIHKKVWHPKLKKCI